MCHSGRTAGECGAMWGSHIARSLSNSHAICSGLDIHRLGRTARAGNEGQGILVLADWEKFFLRKKDVVAAGLHQRLVPHADTQLFNETGNNAPLNDMRARVRDALAKTDERSKEQAYIVSTAYILRSASTLFIHMTL